MTREDYVRALENIRGIVENDTRVPIDTSEAVLAEIAKAMPGGRKPATYGEYNQCVVCCHTPRYCSC